MLGKGYPPPTNSFRWCTPRLKVDLAEKVYSKLGEESVNNFIGRIRQGLTVNDEAIKLITELDFIYKDTSLKKIEKRKINKRITEIKQQLLTISDEKILGIDGIRKGESVARDKLIVASCSKDDGECGQGWFHNSNNLAIAMKLSPILHWRLCHVWDWLFRADIEYGYPTGLVAEVYGASDDPNNEPLAYRTGCIKCPLVAKDKAFTSVVSSPYWEYLKPFDILGFVYDELRYNYKNRLLWDARIKGNERRHNQKGCLTIEARRWALSVILDAQSKVNEVAEKKGKPKVILISDEKLSLINKMLDENTHTKGWNGTEPTGDSYLPGLNGELSLLSLLED